MKNLIVILICFCQCSLFGQNNIIKEGMLFPASERIKRIDYGTGYLANEGKSAIPIILDFFSSDCHVCFRSFPKLSELSEKYASQVQFILVGKDDGKIRKIYKGYETKFKLQFPVIYDSFLQKSMGIKFNPFYIWLDREGVIRGLTGAEALTDENLEQFLKGQSILEKKTGKPERFDPSRPYLVNGNGGTDSNFLLRSVLTKWHIGQPLSPLPALEEKTLSNRFQVLSVSIHDLYNYAFYGRTQWNAESSLYGVAYPYVFIDTGYGLPLSKTEKYSYSAQIGQLANPQQLQKRLQIDLETYFGFDASIEKRTTPCLMLRLSKTKAALLRSAGGKPYAMDGLGVIELKNQPVSKLISLISRHYNLPIINDTGIDHNIDVRIEYLPYDYNELKSSLQKKGLMLDDGLNEMRVIVLKSKKENVAVKSNCNINGEL